MGYDSHFIMQVIGDITKNSQILGSFHGNVKLDIGF